VAVTARCSIIWVIGVCLGVLLFGRAGLGRGWAIQLSESGR